ncbi:MULTISPECIES: hypothetical protein [unclassified Microbacterium]|uniref:hypothetical protein n=1 Tax=unclassified Microbacterium TaxID=2609290 RepID=UPI000EAA0759|nr:MULTISPECIES: hypothetical protein [unclassified Microbacterium]MBT2484846.1 hypothetical protein [Microbacterium sp. ISL-108]RKN67716.1 hypothetical protein D7252_09015 [Microbacterium sp. CGR2]
MDEIVRTALTVLGSISVGLGGAWLLFRGKKVEAETEETKTESAATTAFLNGQVEFQEFVEGVVQQRVTAAVADLQTQVTDLAAKLAVVQQESHEMNDAIRSRETRLWLWNNIEKRLGPMPELPLPILRRLGIGHLTLLPAHEAPESA